jgi:hypothetical protein
LDSSTASALVLARSVAAAHGDADVGGGQHRHIVDPVTEHQHLAPFLQLLQACSLSSGRRPPGLVDAQRAATLATIGELSPDSSRCASHAPCRRPAGRGIVAQAVVQAEPGQRALAVAEQQPLAAAPARGRR